MALAKELTGAFPPGQAKAIGGQGASIAATGSAQADAATLTAGICIVTAADGTKGVILAGEVGDEVWVFNNSASTLKVYPESGAAICVPGTGLGSANAAFSHLTYKPAIYKKQSTTQWFVNVSA
jgi:hypothetical protein